MRTFFSQKEEQINALSHGAGILMGLVLCCVLLHRCLSLGNRLWTFGVVLYLIGMLSSYISSTVYHALPPYDRAKPFFRCVDHAAIYWHIAGSYSPITLIALLNHGGWGWIMFGIQWLCALVGTVISFIHLSDHSHLETACFVVMGGMVLVAIHPLAQTVSTAALVCIFAEGVCYVTGAVFYSLHGIKYMHSVFHFFVLAGSACHAFAVWLLLV